MTPPIGESVIRVTADCWFLGSSRVCERVTASNSPGAITSWEDGSSMFTLRERVGTDVSSAEGSLEQGKMYECGTLVALWGIGPDIICKVKGWCEGMEAESETMQFVRTNVPGMPIPEVMCHWVDRRWNRSFLILRRVSGRTLYDAWPRLSISQRSQIADQVAGYMSMLASITSLSIETATHCGVREPFLLPPDEPDHPSWKPVLLAPLSIADFTKPTYDCPEIRPLARYQHADLGPTNIIISEDGNVTAIIDWESGAFYPEFWIATKPIKSAGFLLDPSEEPNRWAWGDLLSSMLHKKGFDEVLSKEDFQRVVQAISKCKRYSSL